MMPNDSAVTATDSLDSFVRVEDVPAPLSRPDSPKSGGGVLGTRDVSAGRSRGDTLTQHQEAYYLFIMGGLGIFLNLVVIVTILLRRTLRKMTSAFLVHACFLDLLKAAYCLPFGINLLGNASPGDCSLEGSSYVVIVTTSAFNMVAMICAEAFTFGESNVGGKPRGSFCCVLFGVIMVYVCSLVLHLGPTLIGGYFQYNPEVRGFVGAVGNCSFRLGQATGYIASVMWIVIVTLSLVAVAHFICRMYREIQGNQPNRVSMLVRSSITIMDDAEGKRHSGNVRMLVKEASHRAKIFVFTMVAYVICWYPLFLLIIIDVHFQVSPKVYQAFSFIAWSQGTVDPLILILLDRQLNLLARFVYCDRYKQYDAATLAYLMAQNRGPVPGEDLMGNNVNVTATAYHSLPCRDGGPPPPSPPYHHNHRVGNDDDDDDDDEEDMSEVSTRHPSTPSQSPSSMEGGGIGGGGGSSRRAYAGSPGSLDGGMGSSGNSRRAYPYPYPYPDSPSGSETRRPLMSESPGSVSTGAGSRRPLLGGQSPSPAAGRRRREGKLTERSSPLLHHQHQQQKQKQQQQQHPPSRQRAAELDESDDVEC